MTEQQFTRQIGDLVIHLRASEPWASDEHLAALFLEGAAELMAHGLQQRGLDPGPEAVRKVLHTYLERTSTR